MDSGQNDVLVYYIKPLLIQWRTKTKDDAKQTVCYIFATCNKKNPKQGKQYYLTIWLILLILYLNALFIPLFYYTDHNFPPAHVIMSG